MSKPLQHKFSELAPDKKQLELQVATCSEPPQHFNIYDESRSDFFSIAVLIKGQANIRINLKEQTVEKNSLMFLVPNTIKQLVSRSEDAQIYSVIFTSKFLLQIGIEKHEIEMINFNSRSSEELVILTEQELATLTHVIEDLKQKNDSMSEHPYGEEIVKYTFRIFLSEMGGIAVKHNLAAKNRTSRKRDLVQQFGQLVNQHFKEYRSVKYYADLLSITPKYLTEIVHEVTGEPASVFIDEKVMYEAKLLLNDPRLSIGQIADVLHFSDQSFLGKFFKRHLGLSPSQYRSHRLA